jgi:opacity protein-like surface antigen
MNGINADVRTGSLETSVDASFSDLLDNLDSGIMLYYETWKDDRGFLLDVVSARLRNDYTGDVVTADLKVKELIVEGAYVWRREMPRSGVDYLAGVRYVDMDNDLTLTLGPVPVSASAGDSWIEPFVGARYRSTLSDKWDFGVRGDIGGFGIGSDFSWKLAATFSYQMSRRWYLGLGYRYFDIDYDKGDFGFDGSMSGPLVGFAYGF